MNFKFSNENEYFYYQCSITKKILMVKRNYCFTRIDEWRPDFCPKNPQVILHSMPRFLSDEELKNIFANSTWPHLIVKIKSSEAENILKQRGFKINQQ